MVDIHVMNPYDDDKHNPIELQALLLAGDGLMMLLLSRYIGPLSCYNLFCLVDGKALLIGA